MPTQLVEVIADAIAHELCARTLTDWEAADAGLSRPAIWHEPRSVIDGRVASILAGRLKRLNVHTSLRTDSSIEQAPLDSAEARLAGARQPPSATRSGRPDDNWCSLAEAEAMQAHVRDEES